MTPEQLKISIFNYALQGKLVEQRPEEGTAEELYQQIIKVAKKDKNVTEITDEEIPFELPLTWKWCKFGEVVNCSMGKTPPRAEPVWWDNDIPWVSISDMNDYGHVVSTKEMVSQKALDEKFGPISKAGTLLMSFKLTVGRTSILDIDAVHNEAIISIFPYIDSENYFRDYLFYILPIITQWGDSKNAIKGKTLNSKSIANLMVPLAPLKELHRIVTKIEQLLPFVDRYAASYEKLEQFNAKFPEDMKKSILQYAIQGKLVEQRPEEGTAEELYQQIQEEKQKLIKEGKIKKGKPLAEITEDEIPFDIPDSWKWVRLGQCGCFERGSGIKKDEVVPNGRPCVRYGQLYTTYKTRFSNAVSFVSQELFEKCHIVKNGDILMALTGENEYDIALAVTYEGDEKVAMGGDMTRFFNHCMNPLYLTYVLNSRYGILCKSKLATGNIIVHISNDKLASIPIPLPPLKEQNRIVAKIEELIPYCERLSQ